MNKSQNTVEHWDHVARGLTLKVYSNELLAEQQKKKTYLGLITISADVAICPGYSNDPKGSVSQALPAGE